MPRVAETQSRADKRATEISGILAFLGFPITANRMPKRAMARGLNAAKGNQRCGGCGHYFLLWSESVNGAWKDDDDSVLPRPRRIIR